MTNNKTNIILMAIILGVAILMIGATTEAKAWISDSDKAALNYNLMEYMPGFYDQIKILVYSRKFVLIKSHLSQ